MAASKKFQVAPNCSGGSSVCLCASMPPESVQYGVAGPGGIPVDASEFQQDMRPFEGLNREYALASRLPLLIVRVAPYVVFCLMLIGALSIPGVLPSDDGGEDGDDDPDSRRLRAGVGGTGGGYTGDAESSLPEGVANIIGLVSMLGLAACLGASFCAARSRTRTLGETRDSSMAAHCNALNAKPRYFEQNLSWSLNTDDAVTYSAIGVRAYFPVLEASRAASRGAVATSKSAGHAEAGIRAVHVAAATGEGLELPPAHAGGML